MCVLESILTNLDVLPTSSKFHLDKAIGDSIATSGFLVAGWIIDKTSTVSKISVYLSGKKLHQFTEFSLRPDVKKDYPGYKNAENSGFNFFLSNIQQGKQTLQVTATISGKEYIALSKELQVLPFYAFEQDINPPVIIGAIPGSGTRVLYKICTDSGIFMGSNLSHANDALDFYDFFDTWIDTWLYQKINQLSDDKKTKMVQDFRLCVAKHLANIPNENSRWGAKNPRSIHLLSFYHEIYAGLKFIHIVRDGRDMIYANNDLSVIEHGSTILKRKLVEPIDKLHVWSIVNLEAALYGERKLKKNYLRIRFEDMCTNPENTVKTIINFLDLPASDTKNITSSIKTPETVGRWKKHATDLSGITSLDLMALDYFGYL